MKEPKPLVAKEIPREKSFYIAVNYYGGDRPYALLHEELDHIGICDALYQVIIPYKPVRNPLSH